MTVLYIVVTAIVAWLIYRFVQKGRSRTDTATQRPTEIPVTVTVRMVDDTRPETAAETPADERDNWEGSFWEVQEPTPVTARLRLNYTDGNSRPSERTVDVRQFGNFGDGVMLIGHCHLRNATRTFLTSRIQRCVDEETGELVADVGAYLRAKYEASPEHSLDRLYADEYDLLRVLLYVGRADGQLRAAEKAIVRETCAKLANDSRVTDDMIDRMFRDLEPPTLQAFRLAVGRLARRGGDSRRIVLEAAERMVASQKSVHPAEAEAIEYLKKRFAEQGRSGE